MKFWDKMFNKKPKPYDPLEDILKHIRYNIQYIKASLLFQSNTYQNFEICSIKFFSEIKSNRFVLVMDIINSKNVLISAENNECIICNEKTDTAVKCCKKNMCQECVNKWRNTCGDCFVCPHCRKNHHEKKYISFNDSDIQTFSDDNIPLQEKLVKIGQYL